LEEDRRKFEFFGNSESLLMIARGEQTKTVRYNIFELPVPFKSSTEMIYFTCFSLICNSYENSEEWVVF
jgi:hypothetical protein